MLPLAISIATFAPLVGAWWGDLLFIGWITLTVVICGAIPLLAGMHKGYPALGIVGALITIPFAVLPLFGCVTGLIVAMTCSIVIQLIPKIEKPLLSQAEIEAETRKMRGY